MFGLYNPLLLWELLKLQPNVVGWVLLLIALVWCGIAVWMTYRRVLWMIRRLRG